MIWPNKGSTKGFRKIVKNHEYILAYGRNAEIIESCFHKNFEIKDPLKERLQIKRSPKNPLAKVRFPKGLRIETEEHRHFPGPISPGTNQIDIHEGNLQFVDGKLMEDVVLEASFPYKDQMEEFFSKLGTNEPTYDTKGQRWLEVYFTKNGVPYYSKERNVKVISSIIENVPNSGLKDLVSLGEDLSIDNPKPVDLIYKLLSYFSSDEDLVMDFFSGASTTAAAVLKLNTKAKGERKFIMIQLPEPCDEKSEAFKSGYKTIAEIGKERIRRAGRKLNENASIAPKLDIGFRVLKINSSNMADVYYTPDAIEQGDLLTTVDNIKPGRDNPEDLLFQVMLDWGVNLTLPIRKETIQDKTVLFVDDNALIACFDTGITEDLVKELAAYKPHRVVFRDNGFTVMLQIKLDFCGSLISYKLGSCKGGVHAEEA